MSEMTLTDMGKKINEMHAMLSLLMKREKQKKTKKLSAKEVASRSGLTKNTVQAYAGRGRIRSRQVQPGVSGSKRYFLEHEVFDDDGNLIVHET